MTGLWALATFCLLTATAHAANEDGVPLSADAMVGGATLTSHEGATGAWYNPAALGGLARSSIQLNSSIYTLGIRHIEGLLETVLPWESRRDSVSHTDFTSIPSGISLVVRLGEGVGLSIGLFSPKREYFTLETGFASTSPALGDGSSVVHEQRVAYSGRVDTTQAGVGLGMLVSDAIRVGLGLFAVQDTVELTFDFPFALRDAADPGAEPLAFGGTSQRSLVSRWGMIPTAGFQWDVTPILTFAGAVRGPQVAFTTSGKSTTIFYNATSEALAHELVETHEPVSSLSAPARFHLALELRLGPSRLLLEGDLRHRLSGERGADKAVVNGRLAAIVQATDHVWLGGGLFTDRTGKVIEESGDAIDYYGANFGTQFRTPSVVEALGGSGRWDMRTTVAIRYALGKGSVRGLRFEPGGDSDRAPHQARATYHEVSLNLGTQIEF